MSEHPERELSKTDIRYLALLADLEWHSASDVASTIGKATSGVARKLSSLAARGLVSWIAPSDYAITQAGLEIVRRSEKDT